MPLLRLILPDGLPARRLVALGVGFLDNQRTSWFSPNVAVDTILNDLLKSVTIISYINKKVNIS